MNRTRRDRQAVHEDAHRQDPRYDDAQYRLALVTRDYRRIGAAQQPLRPFRGGDAGWWQRRNRRGRN